MLVWSSWRNTLMARWRRLAITRGRLPVRVVEASSAKVVSRTGWSWFSIFQSSDPADELLARGGSGREAGHEVEPYDRGLLAGQVLAPPYDAQGLAGAGVVEVPEGDGLKVPDLKPAPAARSLWSRPMSCHGSFHNCLCRPGGCP